MFEFPSLPRSIPPSSSFVTVSDSAAVLLARNLLPCWVFGSTVHCSLCFTLRSPNPGRGRQRKPYDFSKIIKSQASGIHESSNLRKRPFTKEDYITWHETKAPSWRSSLVVTQYVYVLICVVLFCCFAVMQYNAVENVPM